MPERLGALDIGSLTVRGAVAESPAPGRLNIIHRRQEITALGQDLTQTGRLIPAAMNRTLQAAADIVQEWQALRVRHSRAVATQAVRQAENGPAFLAAVQERLNLPVSLLSPPQEASLTLEGVLTILAPPFRAAETLVVFDLGGGSSEFILCRSGAEPFFASLPLGVLTLSQSHPLGDPPEAKAVAALRHYLENRLSDFLRDNLPPLPHQPPLLVGTAGAVTTLAAISLKMTHYDPDRINNLVLTQSQLQELAATLAALPERDRISLPGLNAARSPVIVAGALMVLAILQVFHQDQLVVSDAGLLEGLLSSLCKGQPI